MPNLEDTLAFALEKHRGQKDKAGAPYVLHPLRMMLSLKDEAAQIVALLHDVVEDCDVSLNDLRGLGYDEAIVRGVEAMTKREGESYEDFILRCKANPIARRVKLADIADNMNLERIREITPQDWERYAKYRRARAVLEAE